MTEFSKPGEMGMFLKTITEEEGLMQNFIDSCNFIEKYYQWKGNNYRNGKVYNPNEASA